MSPLANHPAALAILCVLLLWLFTRFGSMLAASTASNDVLPANTAASPTASLALAATLTLLGLLIGMTLATASTRSAQRQLYQQQEADAIRNAYIRAQLLTRPQSTQVRGLLSEYLSRRITAYNATAPIPPPPESETVSLQPSLWRVVLIPTPRRRLAAANLVTESLNSVLTTRGYAQRAWASHIPSADWLLLITTAALVCLLAGFALASIPSVAPGARRSRFLILLPTLIAASFFLIDDLDTPTAGLLHSQPRTLENLTKDLPHLP